MRLPCVVNHSGAVRGPVRRRLVKSPKVFIRDSGIAHALLDIPGKEVLLAHPVVGASRVGFVVENLLTNVDAMAQPHFYRSGGGAEIVHGG